MKKKMRIGAVLCCSTALLTILGGYLLTTNGLFNWSSPKINNNTNQTTSELETTENVENMRIKLLNKVDNQNGSISYTYTYSVLPSNATRNDISGLISYVDGSEGINEVLDFSIDKANGTFTIVKKGDFSHQAQLVLTCTADPSVKATITLDCKQYFKGYNNITEKTYNHLLTAQNPVIVENIKSDGAETIDADNFSTVFTIPTDTSYRIETAVGTFRGYVTGDDINAMSNANIDITDTSAIYLNYGNNFTSSLLQDLIDADTSLFTDQNLLAFSQKAFFGITYDIEIKYNTAGILRTYTAHVIAAAATSGLNFGLPTALNVETNSVIFEDVQTRYQFVFTDSENNVRRIDHEPAGNIEGWVGSGAFDMYNGYINVEVTRILDGEIIGGPTLIYADNDGKGFPTGTDHTEQYVVFNLNGSTNYNWTHRKKIYNKNFYRVGSYEAVAV